MGKLSWPDQTTLPSSLVYGSALSPSSLSSYLYTSFTATFSGALMASVASESPAAKVTSAGIVSPADCETTFIGIVSAAPVLFRLSVSVAVRSSVLASSNTQMGLLVSAKRTC